MEQPEKKKRKERKGYSRRRQSKSSSYLPTDLTAEILLRLPEKSVVRFLCVSKLWSSITTDPYFIKLFETRSPRPSLLLCFRKHDNMFVSSIPDRPTHRHNSNKSFSSPQPIGCYHTKFSEEYDHFSPTESVHGLICFQNSGTPLVWNPSKREFLTLPKPRKNWNHITLLLGYDPIEGKHKLVCVPRDRYSDVCRVLTLGSAQESWRTVKSTHNHRSSFYTPGRCIKGIIYYLAFSYHSNGVIMSFDVRSEKLNMIQPPSDIDLELLINYRGRLACFDRFNKRRMWLLEDAGEHKWSSQDFLFPLRHFDESLGTSLILKGFTHAGEFIYAPLMFGKSSCILYYDPVRNSCRRFKFERIVGNEYVVGNDRWMFALYAFPNHIDGQISM